MVNKSDEKLVALYLSGEEKALEILLERYLTVIYNFIYRLVLNKHTAEDLTQETFFKFWKNLKKVNPNKKLRPWLYVIAKNTTFDYLRKKKIITKNIDFWENLPDEKIDPAENFDQKILSRDLEKALRKLPEIYRAILILHYKNEFSLVEISQILKMPYNTTKSRYRRGLMILKKIIAPEF